MYSNSFLAAATKISSRSFWNVKKNGRTSRRDPELDFGGGGQNPKLDFGGMLVFFL